MIVTQEQVLAAMQFHEKRHVESNGPLDKISLPAGVSKLADLLGAMWFAREDKAQVPDASGVAALVREALDAESGSAPSTSQGASAKAVEADSAPLPACPLRDNGDETCEVCQ